MQDLCRSCPPQTTTGRLSSSPPGPAPPQLRLQSNQATHGRAPRTRREDPTTEARAATKAPLDAITVAKQKLASPKWPPQQTTRRRCRKPHGEDAATTRRRCRHPLVSRLWPAPRRCPQGKRSTSTDKFSLAHGRHMSQWTSAPLRVLRCLIFLSDFF